MRRIAGLALAVGALLAAALVVVANFGSESAEPCRGPTHETVEVTVAAPSGIHVVGLTTFTDGADPEVLFVGPMGPEAVAAPTATVGGTDVELRDGPTVGCYTLDAALPEDGRVAIRADANSGAVDAGIRIPETADPATEIVAKARSATLDLRGLVESQRVAQSNDDEPTRLAITYGTDGYDVTSSDGNDARYAATDWPTYFYWTGSGTFVSARITGRERRDGRELVRVSGVVPLPLWLEVLVDPETGFVHEQRMLASNHFMDSRFSRFSLG